MTGVTRARLGLAGELCRLAGQYRRGGGRLLIAGVWRVREGISKNTGLVCEPHGKE